MQARIGALGQKAPGIVAMVGDARVRHRGCIGMAVESDLSYGPVAVIPYCDHRGLAEQ
ncbi:C component of insecticidal toxin complex [Pseudomonas sp. CK-NBRI-02]|nr:C component of insecticidal toxin complex [Pseudomonas sp. CK-NBRI-02]